MITSLERAVVVIPVHNEAGSIGTIVTEASKYLPVIVIDDCSDDGSGQLAAEAGATVVTFVSRRGKGMALRCGFSMALSWGADRIITMDGDGQHHPEDIPRLLLTSRQQPKSMIIGGRLQEDAYIPIHRLRANRVASFWINWTAGCHVTDTQSGFRVYPVPILQRLHLKHGGFLLETEVLIKAGQAGFNIVEMPIQTIYHPGQQSHFRPLQDGVMVTGYLLYRGIRFWPTQLRRLFRRRGAYLDLQQGSQDQRHQIGRAAVATAFLPVLFFLTFAQVFLSHIGLDALTPFIDRFYDQRLLHNSSLIRASCANPSCRFVFSRADRREKVKDVTVSRHD